MDVSRRDLIKLGTTAAAASGLLAAQSSRKRRRACARSHRLQPR